MKTHARNVLPILVVLLAAFGLRMFRLGSQPLWSDEIYSVAVAQHSASEVAGWVYRDNHPALYWFTLYPVVHLFGDGALLVRLPSVFMGTLAVALTYAAGRQILGSRRAGLFAALWLSFSPIHVVYSQEARMYAPLALFGIASTVFLYRGASGGRGIDWFLFGMTAAATAHSHNYGLLFLTGQALWGLSLLLWKREKRLVWGSALSLAAFATSYGPMIPALLTQTNMSIGSTGVAAWRDVVDFFEAFGAGFAGFSTPGLTPGRLIRRTAPLSAAVTGGLLAMGLLGSNRERKSGDVPSTLSGIWRSLLLGTCVWFPLLFVYGYSRLMKEAVWQVRGFQVALGCFALLVGAGLALLRPRWLRWVVCLSLMVVAAVNLHPHYFDRYKSTVPDAVAAMEGELGAQDVLFVAPYWNWTPFRYYYREPVAAIGGWKKGNTFRLAGVGTDYADLIDPRSLEIESEVREPIVAPDQFEPDDYTRVWAFSHWATPQRVLEIFGDDVTVMHYDVETREWREILYGRATSLSALPLTIEPSSLHWDNGLRLLGYRWRASPIVGRRARLTLFWVAERSQTSSTYLSVQLVGSDGGGAVEHQTPMVSLMHGLPMISLGIRTDFPTTDWPAGNVVVQDVAFDIPPELPPVTYGLNLQVVDELSQEAVSVAGESHSALAQVHVRRPQEPYGPQQVATQHRKNISFGGQIRLLGYDLPDAPPRPGHHLPVWLHWIAEASPAADYSVQLRLQGSDGVPVTETDGSRPKPSFPTSMWKSGDLIESELAIPLPPEMEGGYYNLALRLVNSETEEPVPGKRAWGLRSREWVVIGRARILPWPLVTDPPAMEHKADARFGEAIELLGYDLAERSRPGEKLTVTLYWRARTSPDQSYSVFVHLLDGAGKLVAQVDEIPGDWLRPTTTWREDEIIVDEYSLALPPELPEATYRPFIGLYEPEAGRRLPVIARGEPVPDRRLPLGPVQVEESR